jgi:hypothetical protein
MPDLVEMGFLVIKEEYLDILIWIRELFTEIFLLNYSIYCDCPAISEYFYTLFKLTAEIHFFLKTNTCFPAVLFGR